MAAFLLKFMTMIYDNYNDNYSNVRLLKMRVTQISTYSNGPVTEITSYSNVELLKCPVTQMAVLKCLGLKCPLTQLSGHHCICSF